MTKRKLRTPYFVSAVLRDGEVTAVTDEGDEFHFEMGDSARDGWPMVSRRMRWRDKFDYYGHGRSNPSPPKPSGPPRLVK